MIDARNIEIDRIEYHRNGVGGNGFHVVAFRQRNGRHWEPMLAVVFNEPGSVAVLDRDKIAAGLLSMFEGAAFRGDYYESYIRAALAKWPAGYNRGNPADTKGV